MDSKILAETVSGYDAMYAVGGWEGVADYTWDADLVGGAAELFRQVEAEHPRSVYCEHLQAIVEELNNQ